MDYTEQNISNLIYNTIQNESNYSERSMQSKENRLGISDLGQDRWHALMKIRQVPETDVKDSTAAWLGTVIGDALEKALAKHHPDWIFQSTVEFNLDLPDYDMSLALPGHPDIIVPDESDGIPAGVYDLKGLALDTSLPTPNGWTTMGEVRVGDWLLDMDGQPAQVTAKSEVKNLRCYEIVANRSGERIVCDQDHLWWVESLEGGSRNRYVRNVQTLASRTKPVHIPLAGPLNTPESLFPADPYLVGYWLGNGQRGTSVITVNLSDAPEVRMFAREAGHYCGIDYSRKAPGRSETYSVKGLLADMRRAGMNVGEKRVPHELLRGSIAQRRSLLAGLMDSDGTWNVARRRAVFAVTDEGLRDDVAELARSLGDRVQLATWTGHGFGLDVQVYGVEWAPVTNPFRLSRKRAKWEPPHKRSRRWHTAKVNEVDSVPTQCVAVDSPTSSFLAGRSMIPTHNSKSELESIRKFGQSLQQKFQVHAYAKAAMDAGTLPTDEPVYVGDIYYDRSAKGGLVEKPHVIAHEYDPTVIDEIRDWLSDVVYAVVNNEDIPSDMPRSWNEQYSPYASLVASGEDVAGLIEDPEQIQAAAMYRDALDLESKAKHMKNVAKVRLKGIQGSTGENTVEWTWVNGGHVSYDREGNWRLSVRKNKGAK